MPDETSQAQGRAVKIGVEANTQPPADGRQAQQFSQEAARARTGLVREFWEFLKHNKKWWLLPILIVLLVIGLLAVLGSTGVGAFMYTVF